MDAQTKRLPSWIPRLKGREAGHAVKGLLRSQGVATVCESARCPNQGECFGRRTATFMILGTVCSRRCAFCAVTKGKPDPPDPGEPDRVVAAARELGLAYMVVTSVTRDDLGDGGAGQFAAVLEAAAAHLPGVPVEVLTPDFGGDHAALDMVLSRRPAVFNHNVETVPRLYDEVRPGADYGRSLALLARAAASGVPAKSGLMVGLGESDAEVEAVLRDLHAAAVGSVTIGQYLRPTRESLPVRRYLEPERFEHFARLGRELGFSRVASGPLVRSSYRAGEARDRHFEDVPGLRLMPAGEEQPRGHLS